MSEYKTYEYVWLDGYQPNCKKLENDKFDIFIGSQSDPIFWKNFFKIIGNVDIILDDGGHSNGCYRNFNCYS